MSRARSGHIESIVDAIQLASSGSTLERAFSLTELPRLTEAGAGASAPVHAVLRFFEVERHAAVAGALTGSIVLQCQRCLGAYDMPLSEHFELVLVNSEDEAPGVSEDQELVVADAGRLDLRWLIDEQLLLALPLVPLHENCDTSAVLQNRNETAVASESHPESHPESQAEQVASQRPFASLADLLQRRR